MMVYWRTKDARVWRVGYQTSAEHGLIRMGLWHGDTLRGPLLHPADIERRPYGQQGATHDRHLPLSCL